MGDLHPLKPNRTPNRGGAPPMLARACDHCGKRAALLLRVVEYRVVMVNGRERHHLAAPKERRRAWLCEGCDT